MKLDIGRLFGCRMACLSSHLHSHSMEDGDNEGISYSHLDQSVFMGIYRFQVKGCLII